MTIPMSSQTTTQIILNKDKDKCKMSFILVFGIFNMCVTSTLGIKNLNMSMTSTLGIQNLSNKTMSQDANDNTQEKHGGSPASHHCHLFFSWHLTLSWK